MFSQDLRANARKSAGLLQRMEVFMAFRKITVRNGLVFDDGFASLLRIVKSYRVSGAGREFESTIRFKA